ncbi:MAG: ABC transporter permease [Roseiflexus sp.]|nr:ABC transporter permease [Roseiflexus sp.]MCS7288720.1 ABC transporter permease [Roseiflexus sp.]MDW8147264.1 ABC transporter permease [Roseiflexaceae bacterium]MDW8232776.1 ABC transporter permease [Roseiflexaceae bacterium]
MRRMLALLSVLTAASKRLHANLGLALCAWLAAVTAVALASAIPAYAEAASLRLLQDEIRQQEERQGRSPFALLLRYVGAWNTPLEWERVAPADDYLRREGIPGLNLPLNSLARHVRTAPLRVFLAVDGDAVFLKNAPLGFMSGLDDRMRIIDGQMPASAADGAVLDVMIARAFADEAGVNVGDTLTIIAPGTRPATLQARVAAIWEPVNRNDPAWFFPPDALNDLLLVSEASFTGPIARALRNEVDQALWFVRLSGEGITSAQVAPLLSRVESVRVRVNGIIPGLRLEQGPSEALQRYQERVATLTTQLSVFSAPILALTLYFAALIAALLVRRQSSEIALLKSRGVRSAQILGMYLVEWTIIGAAALAVGLPLGLAFASVMSRVRSFLDVDLSVPSAPLSLGAQSLTFALVVLAITVVASLLPALAATRRTLVEEQQQTARAVRPPLWQRAYLDLLLLIPAAYGIYQLQTGGGLFQGNADPFSNPLLIATPALLCFALGLLALRLIPLILEGLARLATIPAWVAPLVTLRALARQTDSYRGALLLLILTLSLATYSSTMADTLDGAMRTELTYQVGAMTQLFETGESAERGRPNQPGRPPQQSRRDIDIREEARFLFVPVSEHLQAPGVRAAARVGRYDAFVNVGASNRQAQLIGIDRTDFPKVITRFDRAWGGGESLGGLMNLLARYPNGALVSRDLLGEGLRVGDALPATLQLYGDQREVRFRIVAAIDLWPGFYPQDGPIIVANLNYIFDEMGGQYPYDVWIARDPAIPLEEVVAGVRGLGIPVIDVLDSATLIAREQARPQRQGLFGVLTIGFLTAGVLTLLGFLVAGFITARRRAIELGMLRALGLSGSGVAAALVLEQLLLIGAGLAAGSGIGALAALLIVPFMQVGVGPYPGVPAYPPRLAWESMTSIYAAFGVTLLLSLLALGASLARIRLFQAVKLGDVN